MRGKKHTKIYCLNEKATRSMSVIKPGLWYCNYCHAIHFVEVAGKVELYQEKGKTVFYGKLKK